MNLDALPAAIRPNAVAKRIALPLCALKRRRFRHTHCIAITGSSGKTTTKQMIASILARRGRVRTNRGSMNRAGALARAILSAPPGCDFLVLELGASGPGSLDELVAMSRPDISVLTQIQRDHFRAFRSVEAIAEEKFKVVRRLPPGGIAVLNADDPMQAGLPAELRPSRTVITYGLTPGAEITARDFASHWPEGLRGTLAVRGVERAFSVKLMGNHWIHAVMAAAAASAAVGATPDDMVAGLAEIEPVRGRLSVVRDTRGVTFIEDWGKGSEISGHAALEFLRTVPDTRRVAIFGTIADIAGKPSAAYSKMAAAALEVAGPVFFVGLMSARVRSLVHHHPDRLRLFESLDDLLPALDATLRDGDVVLVKGSQRADHLERIIQHRLGEPVCRRVRCGHGRPCFECRLKKVF